MKKWGKGNQEVKDCEGCGGDAIYSLKTKNGWINLCVECMAIIKEGYEKGVL